MKILIIEDEPVNARELEHLILEYDPTFQVLGVLDTIEASVGFLRSNKPDLVFMDIELADGSAFEIFKEVDIASPIVFVTAYDQHALEAFEQNSIAYLLKPVTRTKILKAFEDYRNMKSAVIRSDEYASLFHRSQGFKQSFLVKFGNQLIPLTVERIHYFYSDANLVYVVANDQKKYLCSHTLTQLEDMLDPTIFFRVNRQFLTHKQAIVSLAPFTKGQVQVRLTPETSDEIIVSRQRTPLLKDWLS